MEDLALAPTLDALPPIWDCWSGISEPDLAPTALAMFLHVTWSAFCRGQAASAAPPFWMHSCLILSLELLLLPVSVFHLFN